MKGITKTGFEFEIDPKVLDDWDILDLLGELQSGNLLVAPKFVRAILGDEEAKKLIDHCRTKNGKAPTQPVLDEIFDIFSQLNEGKNS